jgi:hypothetical protein
VSTWNAPADPKDPDDPVNPALQHPWLYFGAGVALAVGLHLAMGLIASSALWLLNAGPLQPLLGPEWGDLASGLWALWFMGLSVAQLLYLGPAWVLTRRWRPPVAQGILVVATITFLLQGSCYAFFLTTMAATPE